MDMMFEKKRRWSIMCCKSSRGACKTCGPNPRPGQMSGTMGFVSKSWRYKRVKGKWVKMMNNSSNIRMCKFSFIIPGSKFKQGWTMFHEIIHIAASPGDQGYSKAECFHLAKK